MTFNVTHRFLYLEESCVYHEPLVQVLGGAGGHLVGGRGALLDLEDALRPPEHPETLEHVVTAGGDPGEHLDVVPGLLHHPQTQGARHLVRPPRHQAVVAQAQHSALLHDLVSRNRKSALANIMGILSGI